MGFVDRGGGREAKGSSLRRSKKNPGAASTRNKSQNKSYVSPTTRAQARPPPVLLPILDDLRKQQQQQQTTGEAGVLCYDPLRWKQETDGPSSPSSQGHRYVDAAVALLSRKLEEDHAGVIRRASSEGQLQSLLCWCNEVERQQLMVDTCIDHNKLATQRRLKTKDVRSTSVAATKPAEKVKKHVKFSEDGDQSDAESSSVAKTAAPQPVSVVESITHSSSAINDAPEDCLLLCLAGIHVNNIDRTNKKAHEQWIHEVEELAKHDVVLGILSGLNLSRESGTHFAQELLLRQCWGVAARQQLPLVLHLYATEEDTAGASFPMLARTAERAVEVLNELLEESEDEHGEALPSPPSIVLHQALNVLCCSPALKDFVREHRPGVEGVVPVYAIITADLIATLPNASSVLPIPVVSSTKEAVMAMMEQRVLHLSQLLIGTASPWGTPQSIPDEYVRQLPNEPANYPFVVEEIRSTSSAGVELDEAEGLGAKDLMDVVLHNFCRVFFAEYVRDPYGSLLAEGDGEAAASTQANANEGGSSTVEDVAVHAQLTAIRAGLKTKKVGAHAGAGSTYACVECGALLLRADAEVTHAEEPRAPAAAAKSRASEKKAQRGSKKKKKKGDVSSDEDDGEDEGGAATAMSSCDGPLKYWQVDAAARVDPHQCDGEGGLHQPQVRGLRQSQAVVVAATNNVTCASCSSKVGRLREHPSCECGLMIPGLCLCLLENRVELVATQKTSTKKAAAHVPTKHAAESVPTDIPTTTAALRPPAQETAHASHQAGPAEAEDELQKLLREAALERERMESSKEAEEERAAAAAEELRQLKRSKKEKKKNVKANNRSNFTHFRNKDFAPTRGGKSEGDEAMMSDSTSDSDE